MGIRLFLAKLTKRSERKPTVPAVEDVIRQIDGYLAGELSYEQVAKWAVKAVVRERDRQPWPEDLKEAVSALLWLDDGPDVSWAPSREELIYHRKRLSELPARQDSELPTT